MAKDSKPTSPLPILRLTLAEGGNQIRLNLLHVAAVLPSKGVTGEPAAAHAAVVLSSGLTYFVRETPDEAEAVLLELITAGASF